MFNTVRNRLTLIFIGLAVVPLLLTGLIASGLSLAAQEQQALALQHEISRRISTQIGAYVGYTEKELGRIARVSSLHEMSLDAQERLISELLAEHDSLDSLILLDAQGSVQVYVDRMRFVDPALQGDWSERDIFTTPASTRDVYYDSLTFDESTRQPLMRVGFPLVNLRSGLVEGVLVGAIRIKNIWDVISADQSDIEGQVVFVTDDQGRVIAHATPSVVYDGVTFARPQEYGITTGLNGDTVLMAWEPVRIGTQTLWVIAQQPLAQALALALFTLAITGIVLIGALIAAGGAGLLAVRQIVRPVEALANAARKIAAGDLSQQVAVQNPVEIGVLADTFNAMTAQLRQTLEGLETLNADLDRRVIERTTELEQANARLSELDRLKTMFIADMSHELRTPLTVITTSAYLLRRSPPERHADHLRNLETHIERLTHFVNDVFDLSRLELSKSEIEFEPVCMNEVVSTVTNALAPRATDSGLQFVLHQDETVQKVRGANNQLAQVVNNLVTNAIKYTTSGSVEVSTIADAERQRAGLEVKDTGKGIAEEDMPHVFERFYRGKGVGSSTIAGSGLGLAIVKEIVDLHQGSIEVESRVNQGTTFRVWLPYAN